MRLSLSVGLVSLIALSCASAEGDPRPAEPLRDRATSGPLVIELFTSQGCSSCPPADRLLSILAKQGEHAGRPLAPLAFHVDYWNGLGWADPYSREAWTQRQHGYANALGDDRVYTPELVVGGAVGVVGSQRDRVLKAIASAPLPDRLPAGATWTAGQVEIVATAPSGADVFVAIWEDGTKTKVPRGENTGETLVNDRVVRRFERVAVAGQRGSLVIKLDPTWQAVGAVAFAQRPDRRIVATVLLPR